ncbi:MULTISPECIES: CPBP family glutamic-type intramembrane protease [unclassified Luteococcus]|uniref:CPBP family glutamic-type intramembrane protease n=1 Tax=unclassified Luteococcus TaxID=2639923 RepID=UPI00313DE2ED
MTDPATADHPTALPVGRRTAWGRALGMTGVLWLVLGVGCFGLAASAIHRRMGTSVHAAFVLDMVFVVGFLTVTAVTLLWLPRTGRTLTDLGWRRPARRWAWVAGVTFGVLWAALSYAAGGDPTSTAWQRIPMVLAGPVLAFGEEVARAFMLDHLHRATVARWVQVLVGGLAMGSYHGVIGGHFTPTYMVSSVVMFTILSAIYVWGGRSLMPVLVGHALPHVLADPSLTQGILVGLRAMGG